MASWAEFESAAPELGAAGRRLLIGADGVAIGFLASASAGGVAHLSPVCPIFGGENLYVSAGAHTPKAADLGATGRYVLHAFLGAHDEEFQVAGRAGEVVDPAERSAVVRRRWRAGRGAACAILVWLAASLVPSPSLSESEWVVSAASGHPRVASFLEVDAELVTVQVTLSSANDRAAARASELEETRRRVAAAAEADDLVSLSPGVVSLSPEDDTSKYRGSSRADLFLSVPLDPSLSSFEAVRRIHAVVARVEAVGEAQLSAGASSLGVRNAESYRDQLLALVAAEAGALKQRFGPGASVEVSGLGGAVLVSQRDDRRVFLSIAYSLSATF
jgi:hypothetical protein